MAKLGVYRKPAELKDEDRYGPFTRKQVVYVIVTLLLCAGVTIFFYALNLLFIGIILDILLIETAFVLNMKMPEDKYLMGGGIPIETIVLRILKKKLPWNKVIFVKNYDEREI